jgi:Asp-tRNA(Asn)/Glu-tRNA(Gln) amidotransferase B subunit
MYNVSIIDIDEISSFYMSDDKSPGLEQDDEVPPPGVEEIMTDAFIKKAAALAASGVTAKQTLAKQLKVSTYFAGKIMRDERFKQLVEEIADDAVANAKAVTRNDLARLSKKAVLALEKNLDKHNLQAAIVVLRSLGLETGTKDEGKAGGFTLVLAGQNTPQPAKTVVVKEGK